MNEILTNYDKIFKCFLSNCGIDTSELPSDNEGKYDMINNGISHYNSIISSEDIIGQLTSNDTTETLNVTLDGTRLLILAYCIKYIYLENELVGFEELWSPFMKEVGVQQYKSQITGRENTLLRTEQKIIQLLTSIEDPSIM